MRRIGILVVAAVLGTAGVVSAESGRAAANQPAKAARVKPPVAKPAPAPVPRTIKPLVAPVKVAEPAPAAKAPGKTIVKLDPPSASALMQQYQHVGHDLVLLRSERDAKIGVELADTKASCAEVHAEFRTIKLDDAVKTPQSRLETKLFLDQLQRKIDRLRGVALSTDCMNNPLAKDCLGSEGADDAPADLTVHDDDDEAAPAAQAPAPPTDPKS